MVDTCYTFVKTQRMCNTKSEPSRMLWTFGEGNVTGLIVVTNILLCGMLMFGEVELFGDGGYMRTLLDARFCREPKTALKSI